MKKSFKLTREPLYERAYKAVLQMILDGNLEGRAKNNGSISGGIAYRQPHTGSGSDAKNSSTKALLQSSGNTVRITNFLNATLKQLYSCRQALEEIGLRFAIKKLNKEDLQRLDQILNEAERAAARNDFVQLVRKKHSVS